MWAPQRAHYIKELLKGRSKGHSGTLRERFKVPHCMAHSSLLRGAIAKKPLLCFETGDWGPRKEELGEGLAEKVGKALAKGWRRAGEGVAKGWQRVPCTLQLCNSRNARVEERVRDSME